MKEGERFPLLVFLHGIGLGGKDNGRQLQRGAKLFLREENRQKYPAIVVYPQAPLAKTFINISRNGKSASFAGTRKMANEESNRNEIEMSLSPYGGWYMML
ncbi:MAG: hypothetical protein LBG19_06210 [Prevotellaceae bacterium]|jgi:predicted peptidase|nr:hypothetical protein [Prevotellaceae bacterium]